MHYSLMVTVGKDKAENSEEARNYVQSELENDDSFVGEGGRFSSPIADWFVIGGRWSGHLAQQYLTKDFFEEVKTQLKLGGDFGLSTKEVEENKDKIQKVWESVGGKGENPYNRDSYNHGGFEDDAMIVDKTLYEKLLKEFEGEYKGGKTWGDKNEYFDLHFVDLDDEEVSKEFIGKKWIVVVDYHS